MQGYVELVLHESEGYAFVDWVLFREERQVRQCVKKVLFRAVRVHAHNAETTHDTAPYELFEELLGDCYVPEMCAFCYHSDLLIFDDVSC
jgi:hypothetical protein